DLERFPPRPEPAGAPVVILACRMLWDKGVGEFVEAARLLAEAGVKARLVLVGKGDPENPASVPESRLAAWAEEGVIEWWGRREDMPQVFAASHIVCLPSYREGLSVTLMEGAASARPLVAADVPGCRDIVRHEETGLLVPPRDGRALAAALRRLIEDAGLRARLGRNARGLAIAEFAEQKAVRRMLLLYEDELGGRPGSSGSRP
ncbi:MAG TPA: glycosyltransferase family 1 protein, partial [Elusimicrobia bacterium]|nr:glycosyltransferase family 1 protein [Elusimicrobiota bacterium]